jgi:hypothetical protein
VNQSYVCRRCARDLRELLIGDGTTNAVVETEHPKGQPGIVWYIERLRESAYRQTVMERNLGGHVIRSGYDQLGNKVAIDLLGKITWTLDHWDARLDRLIGPGVDVSAHRGRIAYPDGFDGLDGSKAARLADHVTELRHGCDDIDRLVHDLLTYAKDGWRIINRPDDILCGPCPAMVEDQDHPGVEARCSAMLYAEEYEQDGKRMTADSVICPKCHAKHDVSQLREELKRQVRDMLFTGYELLKLMETRLNDRMPKSTFYQLIRDGRLRARGFDETGQPRYTYDDVCEAREKPRPVRVVRKKAS